MAAAAGAAGAAGAHPRRARTGPTRAARTPRRLLVILAAVALAACSAGPSGSEQAGVGRPTSTPTGGTTGATATGPATSRVVPPATDQPVGTQPAPAPSTIPPRPLAADAFAATNASLQSRVADAGLAGGVVLVVRDGRVVHDYAVGRVTRSTPLEVASSAKWLTAATLMTFVDAGAVALDDPVSRWLPEFAGETPAVTVRQLLSHTSGVRDRPCLWDGTRLADCVRHIAAWPREFRPGTAFSYGNAGFHVLGRLIEELGGADFVTVFRRRIGEPLGLTATTWPGSPGSPSPAAGVRTTVDDYSRLLALVLNRGELDGRRILSARSVAELARDQVTAYDTTRDYSVGITRIPRYSLGAWPDVVDARGTSVVVSGNGGRGFYPWVDFSTNSYGVIGVQDDRGAEVAVPASQAVATRARQALTG